MTEETMPATYANLEDVLEVRSEVTRLIDAVEKLQIRLTEMNSRLELQERAVGQQIQIVNELKTTLK